MSRAYDYAKQVAAEVMDPLPAPAAYGPAETLPLCLGCGDVHVGWGEDFCSNECRAVYAADWSGDDE